MFKKPTRKQFIIRRIIFSFLATVSVAIIVTAAVLFMLGYRLNTESGTLQQGALLQFDSRPSGADVYINDTLIGGKTATKQSVIAGTHSIIMKKAGYEDWSRTVTVTPGTLTWLNYTRFVPVNRTPASVQNFTELSQLTFSPDLKYGLAHEAPSSPVFHVLDLRSETVKPQPVTLPGALYSEAATAGVEHSFSIVRWNAPSRHVLLRHDFSGKTEWIVFDTENVDRSVNVTTLLSTDFKDIQFAGTNGSVLYGLTSDGLLRKLDLSAGSISRAFVTHVSTFQMFATNIIVYEGQHPDDAAVQRVGVYRDGDDASNVLREAPVGTPLHVATSQYFGDDYVAIAEGEYVTILKGSYPSAQARAAATSLKPYATFTLGQPVEILSFSPSGEYVLAQGTSQAKSYEIEYKRESGVFSSNGKLSWLDAAHLWSDGDNTLTMRDFDGTNVHQLATVASGYGVTLSQNGRFVYLVHKKDATSANLQRIRMILE